MDELPKRRRGRPKKDRTKLTENRDMTCRPRVHRSPILSPEQRAERQDLERLKRAEQRDLGEFAADFMSAPSTHRRMAMRVEQELLGEKSNATPVLNLIAKAAMVASERRAPKPNKVTYSAEFVAGRGSVRKVEIEGDDAFVESTSKRLSAESGARAIAPEVPPGIPESAFTEEDEVLDTEVVPDSDPHGKV